jgi:hypothetical protein
MQQPKPSLRVGLVAPKNNAECRLWPLGYLRGISGSVYHRERQYDLVFFLNLTAEITFLKRATGCKTFVVGLEPRSMHPPNYDQALLDLADRYMGYRNFSTRPDPGFFEPFCPPVDFRDSTRREFALSMGSTRDHDFCVFARHDPNIRTEAGVIASRYRALLAGPLFGNPVGPKLAFQRRCRFEIISENEINDYYFSEKIGQALLAGCVPVYYGCRRIEDYIPEDLFVNMDRFVGATGGPDVEAVVKYCMTDGVYARHFQAIQAKAEQVLLRYTCEACLTDPVQRYIDQLIREGFRNSRQSWPWRWWRTKSRLKRVIGRR